MSRWFHDKDWVLVRVTGSDRSDFLHRLTTNVLPTSESPLVHNFFLSVNAKVQAEFWVSAQPDYLALLTPATQVERLEESIDRYHFGEKLEVQRQPGSLFVICDAPAELHSHCQVVFQPDPRYGDDCCWCYTEQPDELVNYLNQSFQPMTEVEAERRRIELGRLRYQLDYDDETLFVEVAQEGDFSESKGCYPGQEIVARVLHRGRLNRHLRGFESEVVIPADWICTVDGKTVAEVKSTVTRDQGGSTGYLLVRREYGEVGQELKWTDQQGKEYPLRVSARAGEILTGVEP